MLYCFWKNVIIRLIDIVQKKEEENMYSFDSYIRYSEVDSELNLKLTSLLDYLQDCCIFQSEELGVGIDYLAKNHLAWVLSSWEIRIFRYPRMGESVAVGTWPYHFKGFYGYRNFLVKDAENQTLAEANSLWVLMDTQTMHPVRISEELKQIYRPGFGDALEGTWADRKIPLPETSVPKEPVKVARFHIDTNHHVNNGKYVLVAEEYLPEGFAVSGLRAEYKKAAVLGDTLYPRVSCTDGCVTVVIGDEEGMPYAVIQFLGKEGR